MKFETTTMRNYNYHNDVHMVNMVCGHCSSLYSTQNVGKKQLNLKYYLKNLNRFNLITLL